ncbi:MAG: glycogen/starch synthase [Prolixibacteraceae bacterium]|nr:glycogen/starch synthase [Prolixibacteraceae bacterium]
MESKRILFISQEITPYLPETPMAEISRYLPQGVQERGREIRTFMPLYGNINERRNQLHEVIRLSGMNLVINDTDHPLIIKVASIQSARMQVYFIDNEDYFHRKGIVSDDEGHFFPDNDERAIFFARGVLETVIKLRWTPDIIHCHGWMTALAPIYLKKYYKDDPLFSHAKVIYSVYDDDFEGELNKNFRKKLVLKGITASDTKALEKPDYEKLTKFAIQYADAVVQGSEKINPEISNYIAASEKLFLPYQLKDDYVDAYNDFYDKV